MYNPPDNAPYSQPRCWIVRTHRKPAKQEHMDLMAVLNTRMLSVCNTSHFSRNARTNTNITVPMQASMAPRMHNMKGMGASLRLFLRFFMHTLLPFRIMMIAAHPRQFRISAAHAYVSLYTAEQINMPATFVAGIGKTAKVYFVSVTSSFIVFSTPTSST